MVAYSFQKQFSAPILAGTKTGTIRAGRNRPSRHARPGEYIQLYTGLRTKHVNQVGIGRCLSVRNIELYFVDRPEVRYPYHEIIIARPRDLDAFAVADGFENWIALEAFWTRGNPELRSFDGYHVQWDKIGQSYSDFA